MITYVEMTNQTPGFYEALGPFMCSREVHKELGGPIFGDSRYQWVVAFDGSTVVGWGSVVLDKVATLDWSYVLSSHRQQGIYGEIYRRLLVLAGDREIRATSRNPIVQKMYEASGFVRVGARGSWVQYKRMCT